jgi:DNA-binding transcriptional ArsR family regulator
MGRSQTSNPRFHMTRAKHLVLQLLSQFFVLTTNRLATLQRSRIPTESDQRTSRRTLALLYKAGYVYRIPYLDLDQLCGGATYAYGLSDKGVKEYGGKTFDEHSRRTLDHELAITDFHVSLKHFCEGQGFDLRWLQSHLKRSIHPDAYFSVTDPKKDGRNTNHFFLEIERSKIGNQKNGEPSIMRKLAQYYETYNTDQCYRDWNLTTFRVIVQVMNKTRAENLLMALAGRFNHSMFWIGRSNEQLVYRTPKDHSERTYTLLDI